MGIKIGPERTKNSVQNVEYQGNTRRYPKLVCSLLNSLFDVSPLFRSITYSLTIAIKPTSISLNFTHIIVIKFIGSPVALAPGQKKKNGGYVVLDSSVLFGEILLLLIFFFFRIKNYSRHDQTRVYGTKMIFLKREFAPSLPLRVWIFSAHTCNHISRQHDAKHIGNLRFILVRVYIRINNKITTETSAVRVLYVVTSTVGGRRPTKSARGGCSRGLTRACS